MSKHARYMEIIKDEGHTSKINSKQIRLEIRMVIIIIMLKIIGNDNGWKRIHQNRGNLILF